MHIGISVTSVHAVERPREGARRMVERAAAARDAGLASLFVGDHHVTPLPFFQNVPMLARMLAEWDADDAGRAFGALFLLPLWHPVLLAEQIGTLAALGSGPFVLQCGLGTGRRQFAAFGTTSRERVERFEASLDVLRRLWSGEEVSADRPWRIEGARVSPVPAEPVEVWVGASAEPAIDRAARLGDAWLADPAMGIDAARERFERYREACERHGTAPRAAIRKDVLVASSAREAERRLRPLVDAGYRGFPPEALVAGDAEQVADQLAAYAEAGYADVIVRNAASDQSECLETIAGLGEVVPLVAEL